MSDARSFVIVSRQAVIDSNYSTLVCAPIVTERHGLPTQVNVGAGEGPARAQMNAAQHGIGLSVARHHR
jgi:mRNA-degrading endonuclease toxin of MazEF toxin-antitoxin module